MLPFQSILVAADLSEGSREAFRVACSIARKDESRVFVLNVLEPKYIPEPPAYPGQQTGRYIRIARNPSEHEAMQERLREVYTPNQPLRVEYQTREGDAAEEILLAVEETRSNLVAMGTHGRTGLRRLLAGSVAEKVLRKARCPLLALRSHVIPRGDEPIRVILAPTDFSDGSEAPLQVARLLARDHGSRLVLLHVTPPMVILEGTIPAGIDPQADLDSLEVLRARMDGLDLKYPLEIRLGNGTAAFEILRVAEDVEADLIVMGTHGRSGVGRLVMGSEAENVLRRARCPVLVVKSPVVAPVAAASPISVGP